MTGEDTEYLSWIIPSDTIELVIKILSTKNGLIWDCLIVYFYPMSKDEIILVLTESLMKWTRKKYFFHSSF